MTDVKSTLNHAINLLNEVSDSARLDAEILLAHVLSKTRTFLHAYPEALLNDKQLAKYQQLIDKRHEGIPIAYLINTREFWSLPLRVNENTLIPRPETELLVELTLALLKDKPQATIIDLGTGSGAIALALAREHPHWQVIAADISQEAINTALDNAAQLGVQNFRAYCSNWFDAIPAQQFDAIVSNPPYIAEHDPHLALGDVRFEPRQALISGPEGLDALVHIIEHSHDRLLPGGLLLLEHGFDQKQAVLSTLKKFGYQNAQCWQDWQGHDRVSGGWRKN